MSNINNDSINNDSINNDSHNIISPLQTIQSIQDLQQLEKQLYTNLESLSSNNSQNDLFEKQQIIKRINDLSVTRINLFNTLNNLHESAQSNVSNSKIQLTDKVAVAKIMEHQLNTLKLRLNELKDENNNKLKMVEINTYYGKRYKAHSGLMKLLIVIFILIIIIVLLHKNGILPDSISSALILLILLLGIFGVLYKIWDMSIRNNMNYDEYDIPYNNNNLGIITTPSSPSITNNIDFSLWNVCGEGTEFNHDINQCLVKNVDNTTNIN